jgi:hypothetical protein
MDNNLNSEAVKIVKNMADLRDRALNTLRLAMERDAVRKEINTKLRAQAAILRKIALDGEKQLAAIETKGVELAASLDEENQQYVGKLRAVQPELREIEFKIDPNAMTWESLGPRDSGLDQHNAPQELDLSPENMLNVQNMVNEAMKKMGVREL